VPEHAEFVYSPPEDECEERTRASIVDALSPEDFQRLTAIGSALTIDQVLDLALGRTKHIR
jgi:hypothetical protein